MKLSVCESFKNIIVCTFEGGSGWSGDHACGRGARSTRCPRRDATATKCSPYSCRTTQGVQHCLFVQIRTRKCSRNSFQNKRDLPSAENYPSECQTDLWCRVQYLFSGEVTPFVPWVNQIIMLAGTFLFFIVYYCCKDLYCFELKSLKCYTCSVLSVKYLKSIYFKLVFVCNLLFCNVAPQRHSPRSQCKQ